MARRTRPIGLILGLAVVLSLAACGGAAPAASSGAPASSAAAPAASAAGSDAACEELAGVQSAVASLKAIDLKAAGMAGLTAAVAEVETAVTTLASDARETASTERAALSAAVGSLKTAVTGLSGDASVREKATELTTAIAGVQAATEGVRAAMPGCLG
jgi:hypothetical protein